MKNDSAIIASPSGITHHREEEGSTVAMDGC